MTLTDAKTFLEIAAIIAALLFFLYKLVAGWMLPNLKLSLDLPRQLAEGRPGNDWLVIKVMLEKGSIDGTRIHLVQFRVSPVEGTSFNPLTITVHRAKRLQVSRDSVSWESPPALHPLNLAPGDCMEFSELCLVPTGVACLVEAVVVADRAYVRVTRALAQWRASAISLPPQERTEPNKQSD